MSADLVEIVRAELVSKADELTVLVQVIQQANKQALQQARGELLKLNIERVALRKEIVHLREHVRMLEEAAADDQERAARLERVITNKEPLL
jgi:hypothetical protein